MTAVFCVVSIVSKQAPKFNHNKDGLRAYTDMQPSAAYIEHHPQGTGKL